MNPKINKLRAEVEKNNAKIATLQAKNKALESRSVSWKTPISLVWSGNRA